MLTTAPRGTKDILPEDIYIWQYIENIMKDVSRKYNFKEIRTPVFEHTELFLRGVGETTDIVQKEMYTFNDKGNRSITLKPEGTAPVVRAFIENKIYALPQPTKLYYLISAFRYERPQAGRLREFHQYGVEVLGSDNPSIDAEIIDMAMTILNNIGIKNLKLKINSIGCKNCRADYNNALKKFLKEKLDYLCDNCKNRYETNPLRILDCKDPDCRKHFVDVPIILNYLCDDCKKHFESLKKYLDILNIAYEIDPGIVRGLDYYTKTAFEIISKDIGAQSTVCGGGRYDSLIKDCGGPDMPGIGFAMGIERLIMTIKAQNIDIPKNDKADVFIASIGENADTYSFKLLKKLRDNGLICERDYQNRSLKAQLKYADKINAKYVVIIGEDEIANKKVIIKNMAQGIQIDAPLDDAYNVLKEEILK